VYSRFCRVLIDGKQVIRVFVLARYHAEECTPPLTFESYLSGPLPEKVRSDIAKDVPR
jgi:hypothetical protein